MFRKAFSKALLLQLNKSACHAVQPRPLRIPVLRSLQPCQNYLAQHGVRTFATIPSTAVVKPASTENGIDISERAIKVKEISIRVYIFCINNPKKIYDSN